MYLHIIALLFSLAALSLSSAIPNSSIKRRSYLVNYTSRISTFRSLSTIAPGCLLADGTPCPENADCHLGYQIVETIYIDCQPIVLCKFQAWEGDDCTKTDNSDEVCQQNEEEIVETIAESTGWTKDVAAEKLAKMWEMDGKVTMEEVCNGEKNSTEVPVTAKPDVVAVAPPVQADKTVVETEEESKKAVANPPILAPVLKADEPEKVEKPEDGTTTVRVKMTSTIYLTPSSTATSSKPTASSTSNTAETELSDPGRGIEPGYGRASKRKPWKGGCYWNAGCLSFNSEF
ncbi:hypothetical protein BJ508DRAFT_300916 [Ascobolus immersus RN42]|uniref:Uncharacterized protein n=1 Tax=Ascobolus immersus RN42 TaxID=1160509 RepID=A0A3N4J169_ASCIM|nr:hypothetical protein BJ508DRAFT_300916 [Ascobolus immersus RN42]